MKISLLRTCIYGLFWLMILSPYTIFMILGCISEQPTPTAVEIIGVLVGSYFYYEKIWIPVRVRFITYDNEFCEIMGWR